MAENKEQNKKIKALESKMKSLNPLNSIFEEEKYEEPSLEL